MYSGKKVYFLLLTLALLLFNSSGVFTNQIFLHPVSLEDLVAQSKIIVVAEKKSPPYTSKEKCIDNDCVKYPVYHQTIYHFKIKEYLKKDIENSAIISGNNGEIDVLEAFSEFKFSLHVMYYKENLKKSVSSDSYHSSIIAHKENIMILFLVPKENGGIEFTVGNAVESVKMKNRIKELINKQ